MAATEEDADKTVEYSINETSPLLRRRTLTNDDDDDEVKLSKCGSTWACNPHLVYHRYLVLIVMCFLSFGSYFCFDNPAALQDSMIRDLDLSESQYMSFYSWYSWPNVILCFFGGYLIDVKFGVRWGAIIFSIFVTVGQVLFALGGMLDHYWLMCVGRFVFGIGGESLCVAQNTYAVKWFMGRELNMVFGLQLSFSRVGSTVNMNVMGPLYNWMSETFHVIGYKALGVTLFFGVIMCLLSLVCAVTLAYFDRRNDRILKKADINSAEKIRIKDVKDFPAEIWLLSIVCVAYYVTVFPFIGLGLLFFEMKWDLSPEMARSCNSLVYIISAVASPFFGFMIDKTGRNIYWMIVGIVITLGCHAMLAFTFATPFLAMSIMGLSYSILASALWPMAAWCVKTHQLGTVYGIMQAIQNLGLAVISIVAGLIVDSKGYLLLEVFFLAWLCVALITAVILYLVDASKGGILNMSAKKRLALRKAKADAEAEEKEEELHRASESMERSQ